MNTPKEKATHNDIEEKLTKIVISAIKPYTSDFSNPSSRYFAVSEFSISDAVKHLLHTLTAHGEKVREEERERIKELLFSGQGRKTGVWHYELNDANEMEASWTGKYISIEEVKQALKSTPNHEK